MTPVLAMPMMSGVRESVAGSWNGNASNGPESHSTMPVSPLKSIERGDSLRSLAAGIVLQPDQCPVVGDVESEVAADRRGDDGAVIKRRPLRTIDRRLAVLGADDDERLVGQAAVA